MNDKSERPEIPLWAMPEGTSSLRGRRDQVSVISAISAMKRKAPKDHKM